MVLVLYMMKVESSIVSMNFSMTLLVGRLHAGAPIHQGLPILGASPGRQKPKVRGIVHGTVTATIPAFPSSCTVILSTGILGMKCLAWALVFASVSSPLAHFSPRLRDCSAAAGGVTCSPTWMTTRCIGRADRRPQGPSLFESGRVNTII